ncbi:MAG TPA: FAD-binding oxidoreductase [Candidatus Polarisedimenticolaceae bacterium]
MKKTASIRALSLPPTRPSPVLVDPDLIAGYLEDASSVGPGTARGLLRPDRPEEAATFLRMTAGRELDVLPQAARSSLTGAARPRGEVVITCERWTDAELLSAGGPAGRVRCGAGVRLRDLQRWLGEHGRFFPPIPTYQEAMIGGTIATDAGGAATFKYGKTRAWVRGIEVLLFNGDLLKVERGECVVPRGGTFRVELPGGRVLEVPTPTYLLPAVKKLSCGYWSSDPMDLVDLFVGSEGTLGMLASATLDLVPLPPAVVAGLAFLPDSGAALALSRTLCSGAVPGVRSVEMLDDRCLSLLKAHGDAEKLRVTLPAGAGAALIFEIEMPEAIDRDAAEAIVVASLEGEASRHPLAQLVREVERHGAGDDFELVFPGDDVRREALAAFREAAPKRVNEILQARRRDDAGIAKVGGDLVVPPAELDAAIAFWREGFAARGLEFAIWGHVSDGNLHPNALPRSLAQTDAACEVLLDFARDAGRRGGAPLAEHGVGRSPLKQRMLREFLGEPALAEMRAIKDALDPDDRFSPGVLFPARQRP